MKKYLLKPVISGLLFCTTVGACYLAVNARSGFTASPGDKLSTTQWNNLVNNVVPSGEIAAFNLANCPTGRKPADGTSGTIDLRGEFIRGLDNSRGVDSGRTLGSFQDGTIFQYEDRSLPGSNSYRALQVDQVILYNGQTSTNYQSLGIGSNPAQPGFKSRPRNVALLYCVKN